MGDIERITPAITPTYLVRGKASGDSPSRQQQNHNPGQRQNPPGQDSVELSNPTENPPPPPDKQSDKQPEKKVGPADKTSIDLSA